eukprot:11158401-Lingulodinium_polyedra.AAC.1
MCGPNGAILFVDLAILDYLQIGTRLGYMTRLRYSWTGLLWETGGNYLKTRLDEARRHYA